MKYKTCSTRSSSCKTLWPTTWSAGKKQKGTTLISLSRT